MRVKLLQATRLYWNYALVELKEGEEAAGELARHLFHHSAPGTVEVAEADPEPEPAAEPAADQGEGTGANEGSEVPPSGGTIDELMTWVGTDPARAHAALLAEQAKDQPRATVVNRLTALTV